MGLIAQCCKQARLSLEATQAVDEHDASVPQHQLKAAGSWVSEQHHTQNIIQDTPECGGEVPTTQHETCIEPAPAVAINTAADQKGAEHMAQPDPDPDRATAVASAAESDGDSSTDDMPTICDGNPSPMEDISHNEDIPVDAASTPTPEKPQLAHECSALVCMATDYNYDTDSDDDISESDGDESPMTDA